MGPALSTMTFRLKCALHVPRGQVRHDVAIVNDTTATDQQQVDGLFRQAQATPKAFSYRTDGAAREDPPLQLAAGKAVAARDLLRPQSAAAAAAACTGRCR